MTFGMFVIYKLIILSISAAEWVVFFKKVSKDGTVEYYDCERAVAFDKDGFGYTGSICNILDEMFPVTMPNYPPTEKYKLYTEEFTAKGFPRDNEDFNTRAVHYVITPKGERIEINRYFADAEKENMVEISKEEYEKRKSCEEENNK